MKLFTFIMSSWLLFLSCLPCGDRQECNTKSATAISANNDHHQHKHSTEYCTPFCTCSCCATSAFYQATTSHIDLKLVFQTKRYSAYTAPFCAEVSYAIWQPPKLS